MQSVGEYAKLKQGQDCFFCKPNLRDNQGRVRDGPAKPSENMTVPWGQQHLVPGTQRLTCSGINQVCHEYVDGSGDL